jgi:hypothetical protein
MIISYNADYQISVEELNKRLNEIKAFLEKARAYIPKTEFERKKKEELVLNAYTHKGLYEGMLKLKAEKGGDNDGLN